MADKLRIVIDTREQAPYAFAGMAAAVTRGTLASGDYSLAGAVDRVAVERKSLDDFIRSITAERARFMAELARLRGYDAAALVVEAPYNALEAGWYRSRMSAGAAVQTATAIQAQYRMPIFYAMDRAQGERFVFDFLRHWRDAELRRAAALAGAGRAEA